MQEPHQSVLYDSQCLVRSESPWFSRGATKVLKKAKEACSPSHFSLPSSVSVMAWFGVSRAVTCITVLGLRGKVLVAGGLQGWLL